MTNLTGWYNKSDRRQLQPLGIQERRVQPAGIVLFTLLPFWETYRWYVVAVVALIALQALLIALLLIERRKRQRAAQDLRKSEQRKRDLLDNASDIIYTHDLSGNFTSLNRMGETMIGYTLEEACRMNVSQVVAPEHLDLASRMIARKLSTNEATTYELEIIAKDGHRIAIEVSTRLIYDGGRPVEVEGIARDITDRKRSADDVVEWKNRYEAAVQSSSQILYDWDPRTNEVTYGGDLERILGYSPSELNGGIGEWLKLVHPDDRAAFNYELERVIATEDSFKLTYRVCRRDGTEIWIEDRGHFFRDSTNQIKRMVGLLEDITERRRAEDLIRQLNIGLERRVAERTAELDAKTRELETFAYSVAHDLKAPLRGIDGYSRLLLEGYADKLDEEGKSFLQTIASSSEEMSQLIEDLLAYSRLERWELRPDRLDLRPLVESVVEQKRQETSGRDIDFVVNINGVSIVTDANGLTQALRNYLDNAIKFTHSVATPRIEVGAQELKSGCRLWVRDNGVGFDMKYHDQIFEIFRRLHRDDEYSGTGVGLAIVRKAMERIGGRAWAESELGRGATFYLEIPNQPAGSMRANIEDG